MIFKLSNTLEMKHYSGVLVIAPARVCDPHKAGCFQSLCSA